MNNITTIIPVNNITSEDLSLLENALNSLNKQNSIEKQLKVIVIYVSEIQNLIDDFSKKTFEFLDIKYISNSGSGTIQNQINTAIENVETEYFSYLEFDDEFTEFYFKHVDNYIKNFKNVSLFLPLNIDIVKSNNMFVRYTNAEAFARDVTEEQGFITHDTLKKMPVFNSISGGIFKLEDFVDLGKLKENIKYSFIYEYLLRITNQDQKIMVIPKLGYIHVLDRPNSYTASLNASNISKSELNFWFETAKKEYHFTKIDRKVDYKEPVA